MSSNVEVTGQHRMNQTDLSSRRVLGVILARGGSQGLARKHMLPLLGKPVIRYTFEHALSARLLTNVVVSTDCPDILAEAEAARIHALRRPSALATSDASVQDVLLHAMDHMEKTVLAGAGYDAVVTLYGNVPVRPDGVIDGGIEMLFETGGDSVRSFVPVGKWHPQWMAQLREGRVLALHPGSVHRRQDLTELFLHDGGVVVSRREIMEHARKHRDDPHAFFGTDRRGLAVGQGETIEIDHQRDLYWAEAVLRDRTARTTTYRLAS
jgi:CMP-N-acetylneuraminic acid synthetase